MKTLSAHLIITAMAGIGLHGTLRSQFTGLTEFGIYAALFFLLWLSSYLYNRRYFRQFWRGILLFLFFTKQLWVSNLEIIYYVVTPGLQFRPAILRYELKLNSDAAITLLANLITLTPGTLSLDVSDDRKYLYFHSINVPDGDLEALREKIHNGFEKRILALTK